MKKATRKEIVAIKEAFIERYDEAVTELTYSNAFELVIAVALSAQCTDKSVNILTPELFEKYPDAITLANPELDDVKAIINSCSFFNNKGKDLIKMSPRLVEVYEGKVPLDEKELQTLAVVGQKTANVVMLEYTGANLMAVGTHVFRVAHRLGLSDDETALKTEDTLVKKFKTDLHALHQGMVLFGRYICTAQNPKCDSDCFLQEFCKTKKSFKAR